MTDTIPKLKAQHKETPRMAPPTFAVSYFKNKSDTIPQPRILTLAQLEQQLSKPDIRTHKDGPLISPARYREGTARGNNNVMEISMLFLDVDHNGDLVEDPKRLEDFYYAVYTTFSHSETEAKFRIVVPLAAPVPADKFKAVWYAVNKMMGDKLDGARKDESGMYYLPAVPPERKGLFRFINHDGPLLDWRELDLSEPMPGADHSAGSTDTADGTHTGQASKAVELLVPFWPKPGKKKRHDFIKTLAGVLLRGGFSEENATGFIEKLACAADKEMPGRIESGEVRRLVSDTAKRITNGAAAYGIPKLTEFLGDAGNEVLGRLQTLLGLRRPESGSVHASYGQNMGAENTSRMEFSLPVNLASLTLDGEQGVEWCWHGYLGSGVITLLIGLWKAGKTTLLAHLLKALETGGDFLKLKTKPSRILVISEEPKAMWFDRKQKLGIGIKIDLMIRPFRGKASGPEWDALIDQIAAWVSAKKYDLVIFDSMPNLWPVSKENEAGEVSKAVLPIRKISDAGAAVLLVHHPRKGDAGEGQASRGSGFLPGFADIIIELRRHQPENHSDRRRTLIAYSRFDETRPEATIELKGTGYWFLGAKADVKQTERTEIILEILPDKEPGLTHEEVLSHWPQEPKPGSRALKYDLADLCGCGLVASTGAGVKGDPKRFFKNSRIETPSDGNRDIPHKYQDCDSPHLDNEAPNDRKKNSIPARSCYILPERNSLPETPPKIPTEGDNSLGVTVSLGSKIPFRQEPSLGIDPAGIELPTENPQLDGGAANNGEEFHSGTNQSYRESVPEWNFLPFFTEPHTFCQKNTDNQYLENLIKQSLSEPMTQLFLETFPGKI